MENRGSLLCLRQSEVVESIQPTECQEELGSMDTLFTVEGWLLKKSPTELSTSTKQTVQAPCQGQ
jgi:hypothetical protein